MKSKWLLQKLMKLKKIVKYSKWRKWKWSIWIIDVHFFWRYAKNYVYKGSERYVSWSRCVKSMW